MGSDIQLMKSLRTDLYTFETWWGQILNVFRGFGTNVDAFESRGININDFDEK